MLVNGPGMIGLDLVIIHKGQGFYREWCTVLWNWLTLWRILLSLACYQWNVLMFSCRCLSMNMLHWCWWYFHGRVCFITKFRTPSWRKRSRSQQTLIVIQLFHLGRFWGNLLFSEGGFSSNLYIGSWKGLDYRRHRWWGWTTVDAVKPRLGGSFFFKCFFFGKKKISVILQLTYCFPSFLVLHNELPRKCWDRFKSLSCIYRWAFRVLNVLSAYALLIPVPCFWVHKPPVFCVIMV